MQIAVQWQHDWGDIFVVMYIERCGLVMSCCKMQCDGCMIVAWVCIWGGGRSWRWKVIRVRGGCGADRFQRNQFSHGALRRLDANRIIMTARMGICCCKTHCNRYMTVAWGLIWKGSRNSKSFIFLVKRLQPAIKGTSRARRVWFGRLVAIYKT